ncbi:hypothetical protein [Shewanella sp.]|uniref:hypothetical protein n=1 Tax=Shewanella sp. TaxID=50422 RepID=UPI003D0F449C
MSNVEVAKESEFILPTYEELWESSELYAARDANPLCSGGIYAGCASGAGVGPAFYGGIGNSVKPNPAQMKNINRFQKKIPANAKENIQTHQLPNDGVAVQATSPGKVSGSKAVYEKQIDAAGKTTQYTKTTYDPQGNIVHVKDKLNGGVFP